MRLNYTVLKLLATLKWSKGETVLESRMKKWLKNGNWTLTLLRISRATVVKCLDAPF